MSTATLPQVIQDDLNNRNQSWNLERITVTDVGRFRIRIRRNAYDEQSWGIAEVWTDAGWSQVVHRDINELRCKSSSYVRKVLTPGMTGDFDQDANDLLAMAYEVVR